MERGPIWNLAAFNLLLYKDENLCTHITIISVFAFFLSLSCLYIYPMSESPNPSWASWAFPPFSDLINSTDCNVTTNYIADSVLLVTNGDYLTNSKLGDIGFLLEWLATLIPDGYGGLPANPDGGLAYAEYLMLWYFAVWQNTTYLGDLNATESMAYLATWNHAHEFGYNCPSEKTGKEMICDKLDIQGDPDVSGRGVRSVPV